jgi:hypothetical protein
LCARLFAAYSRMYFFTLDLLIRLFIVVQLLVEFFHDGFQNVIR